MLRRLSDCNRDETKRARPLPVRAIFALVLWAALLLPVKDGEAASRKGAGFDANHAAPMLVAAQSDDRAEEDADTDSEKAQPAGTSRVAGKAPGAAEKKSSIRLFGTVEFRGELKNMPKWQRVVAAEQKSRTFDGDLSSLMRGSVHKQWLELMSRAKGMSDLEKAKAVTVFFNRWPYKTDQMVYNVPDYWATPREFILNSGDCEDYAITKFYALIKLGVDPESMRVVALKDAIRNLAHAVLVIYTNNDAYILDNLTDMTLTHARYTHYLPQYSINEVYRWAHVRPKKK